MTAEGTPRTDALRRRDFNASSAESLMDFLNEVFEECEQLERELQAAESRAASAEKDAARLNWAEKHLDAANVSGYGADDKWVSILHHDGNKAEGASLRDAIDAALSA